MRSGRCCSKCEEINLATYHVFVPISKWRSRDLETSKLYQVGYIELGEDSGRRIYGMNKKPLETQYPLTPLTMADHLGIIIAIKSTFSANNC